MMEAVSYLTAKEVDALNEVACELFTDKWVTTAPLYLYSIFMQPRLSLFKRRPLGYDLLEDDTFYEGMYSYLNIYEAWLLDTIWKRNELLIPVPSGAGSGKSSTFKYAESQIGKYCIDAQESPNPFGFLNVMAIVDFYSHIQKDLIKEIPETDREGRNKQKNVLFESLSAALHSKLTTTINNNSKLRFLFKSILYDWELEGGDGPLETVLIEMRDKMPACEWELPEIDDSQFIARWKNVKGDMQLWSQVIAGIIPFVYLAITHQNKNLPTFLVIDNTDPLVYYLQEELCQHFESLTNSPNFKFLKIVVPVRLTTVQSIYSQKIIRDIKHKSLDPARVIYARLCYFLIKPNEFKSFKNLSENSKLRSLVMNRMLLLWCNLSDKTSYFRKMLSAMGGTNIRNTCNFVIGWVTSDLIPPTNFSGVTQDQVGYSTAVAVIEEAEQTLAFAMESIFRRNRIEDEIKSSPKLHYVIIKYAKRICDSFVNILLDRHLVSDTNGENGQWGALLGDLKINKWIDSILMDKFVNKEGGTTSPLELATSKMIHNNNGVDMNTKDYIACRIILVVDRLFPRRLAERANLLGKAVNNERACLIIHYILGQICSGKDKIISEPTAIYESIPKSDNSQLTVCKSSQSKSRFFYSKILFDQAFTEGTSGERCSAVNLFSSTGIDCDSIPLRILYWKMFDKSDRITSIILTKELKHLGYRQARIEAAYKKMGYFGSRLIYSNRYSDPIEWAREALRPIYISAAGLGYFRTLLESPPYLQWALLQLEEVQKVLKHNGLPISELNSVAKRTEATLIGFKEIIDREYTRLENYWEKVKDNSTIEYFVENTFDSVNASADVYFRNIYQYIRVLCIYITSHQLTDNDKRNAMLIGEAWIEYAKEIVSRHKKTFKNVPATWEEDIHLSERKLDFCST